MRVVFYFLQGDAVEKKGGGSLYDSIMGASCSNARIERYCQIENSLAEYQSRMTLSMRQN